MRFLLRMAFWIGLALVVLPLGKTDRVAPVDTLGPAQAFYAVSEAVEDLSAICERKPGVCAIGRQAISFVGAQAREGARLAYEALDERFGEPDRSVLTGTVKPKP